MAEYRLHCFAESGNAYKAALMLTLSGADWEQRFVDYFKGETRTPEYRAVNVMGEVPVLEHDGRTLSQSGIILDYLAAQLGQYGPANPAERQEIWRWILFDNHKLTSYTATLRFMLTFTDDKEGPVIDWLRTRSQAALAVLNTHLSDRQFVAAPRPTIADFSLCGYLFFEKEFNVVWKRDYPAIGAWLGRIAALPGWVHPYELTQRSYRPE